MGKNGLCNNKTGKMPEISKLKGENCLLAIFFLHIHAKI